MTTIAAGGTAAGSNKHPYPSATHRNRSLEARGDAGGGDHQREQPDPPPPDRPKLQTVPNADFTMVVWFGTEYHFALGVQSSAVRVLWEEWERTGLGLHQNSIREKVDSERDNFRMDTVFRNHRRVRHYMIQRCGDGRYRLVDPTARANTTGAKS